HVGMERRSVSARAGRRKDRLDNGMAGISHLVVLFAIAIAFELDEFGVERRNFHISQPARNRHTSIIDMGFERLTNDGRVAKRGLVYPGYVRWVEQIISEI